MTGVLLVLALLTSAAPRSPLPDPKLTPGAVRPNVTAKEICAPTFRTKAIRPPSSYTNKLKRAQMQALGLTVKPKAAEEDHLVPLELAGAPMDPANLWPQLWAGPCGAHQKDRLENALKRAVCDGRVSLEHAQRAIALNWVDAYHVFVGPLKCEAP